MFLMPNRRGVFCLLAALLALSPLGCGNGGSDNVSISGKVAYANGQPLTTGRIVFTPLEEGEEAPTAVIQQDGTFKFLAVDGTPPGEYRVSLAPPEESDPAAGEQKPDASDFSVPRKYLQADTSGWTATVKESGNEPFTFTISQQ